LTLFTTKPEDRVAFDDRTGDLPAGVDVGDVSDAGVVGFADNDDARVFVSTVELLKGFWVASLLQDEEETDVE